MAVVGSAEIIVRAITNKVKDDIQKAFQDARPVFAKEGDAAGKEFSDSFGKSLSKHLTPEAKNAARDASNAVSDELEKGLGTAGRRASQNAGNQIENELKKSGRRGAQGLMGEFTDVLQKDFVGAVNRLFTIAGLFDVFAPAIANLVGAISAVVSGLFSMGAAASYAAGAVAVLPGLLGAAAQAFGAIKLGSLGVGAAIKAGAQAQTAAGGAAAKSAKAAGTATTAARALQKAQDALTQAQKEARAAQNALNAAQDRAKEGAEEQAEAERRAAAAQQNRTTTLADPNASAQMGADAQKAADDAGQAATNLARTRVKAQEDVRKAGEKNDTAQAKLAAAQKARDNTQKANKTAGIPSGAAGAVNAYQNALAKLTPEAQAFVKEVLSMRAAFKEVGDAISVQMFPPLTKALKLLQSSSFFDILKKNLSVTGGIIGNIGLGLAKAFTTDTNQNRFSAWLAGNNDILDTFNTKTKDGVTPVTSLMNIILKLGLAIQPITKRFVEWAASMITAFDAAHSVGDLKGFFKQAGDAAAQLGRIFGNLFDIIGALGGASKKSGQGLLDSFEKATQKLSDFLNTPKQQKVLQKFFADTADNLRDIGDLVVEIGKVFLGLGDNKGVGTFAKSLIPAVDVIGDISDKLTTGDMGKSLGDLATKVGELINSFTQTGQTKTFIDTLSAIVTVVTKLTNILLSFPGAGQVLAFLAVFRAARFASQIAGFGKSFDLLRGSLFKLAAAPFKKIAAGIKSAVTGKPTTSTTTKSAVPDAKDDASVAHQQGFSLGESLSEGLAEGIKLNAPLVDSALDKMFLKLHTEFSPAVMTWGESMGKDLVDGLALGIRTHFTIAANAATELGDSVIDALKIRLGIHSPSTVMQKAGDDTGEGYILGVRERIAGAFRAGEDLADATAAGARSGSVQTAAAGRTAAPVAGVKAAASPGVDSGVVAVSSKLGAAEKSTGKFAGTVGKLTGAFKGLGSGALALVGGPFGALLIAMPLLIAGFTALYKKSPEFRKFVDTIVKAIKPIVDAFGRVLLKALNSFFGWINDHMPQIEKVVGTVFGAISKVITTVVLPALKFLIDHWRLAISILVGPLGIAIALITKYWDQFKFAIQVVVKAVQIAFKLIQWYVEHILINEFKILLAVGRAVFSALRVAVNAVKATFSAVFSAIGKLWDSVLHPIFSSIRSVASSVFGTVKNAINGMKSAFSGAATVMGKAKDAIVSVFNGLKSAASAPIKFVVNTLWNNGIVSLVDKIPGVSAAGWRVNTKGWAKGGYTGPGGKYEPAGIVHRDEFVIKKSSRRALESVYPGLLDFINLKGKLPHGHSSGGAAGYNGNVPSTFRSLPGYALGGSVIDNIKDKLKSAAKSVVHVGGIVIKWPKDVVKGGINWTKDKVAAAYGDIKAFINFVKNAPNMIANNMSGSWGNLFKNIPKASVNAIIDKINDVLPDALPGVPLGHPFSGVGFRARGGRVRKGNPYVVGELRPELFVPDSSGSILPNLARLTSSNAIADILKQLATSDNGTDTVQQNTTNNNGQRTVNVNITNPAPERSSQSVAKAVRSKAIAHGWSV